MNEKQQLLDALRESRDALVSSLDGVSDAEALWTPGPGQWSILECVEHVAIAEPLLFRGVSRGKPITEPAPDDLTREERFRSGALDRSRKLTGPEPVQPHGRFASVSEAVAHFVAAREQTIAWVESCSEDLRSKSTMHPLFGRITCQECLALLIGHPARHAAQIREIREKRHLAL